MHVNLPNARDFSPTGNINTEDMAFLCNSKALSDEFQENLGGTSVGANLLNAVKSGGNESSGDSGTMLGNAGIPGMLQAKTSSSSNSSTAAPSSSSSSSSLNLSQNYSQNSVKHCANDFSLQRNGMTSSTDSENRNTEPSSNLMEGQNSEENKDSVGLHFLKESGAGRNKKSVNCSDSNNVNSNLIDENALTNKKTSSKNSVPKNSQTTLEIPVSKSANFNDFDFTRPKRTYSGRETAELILPLPLGDDRTDAQLSFFETTENDSDGGMMYRSYSLNENLFPGEKTPEIGRSASKRKRKSVLHHDGKTSKSRFENVQYEEDKNFFMSGLRQNLFPHNSNKKRNNNKSTSSSFMQDEDSISRSNSAEKLTGGKSTNVTMSHEHMACSSYADMFARQTNNGGNTSNTTASNRSGAWRKRQINNRERFNNMSHSSNNSSRSRSKCRLEAMLTSPEKQSAVARDANGTNNLALGNNNGATTNMSLSSNAANGSTNNRPFFLGNNGVKEVNMGSQNHQMNGNHQIPDTNSTGLISNLSSNNSSNVNMFGSGSSLLLNNNSNSFSLEDEDNLNFHGATAGVFSPFGKPNSNASIMKISDPSVMRDC